MTRLSLAASLPLLLLAIWTMVYADVSIYLVLLVLLIGGLLVAYSNYQIHRKAAYQFRSLSNLLEAMVHEDYSLRARDEGNDGALSELISAINGLANRLSEQRIESVESQLLLQTVIEHIDVAIIALNVQEQIHFANPAARKLLQLKQGLHASLLEQLDTLGQLESGQHQVIELTFGTQQGRFNVHVEHFRSRGLPHKLLFITDVRTLLRNEERKAWQNLVRVISHEINNSLTPIASLSQTLLRLLHRQTTEAELHQDLAQGLALIHQRANGLSQFINSYQKLTHLPAPTLQLIRVSTLIDKVIAFFPAQSIQLESTPEISLHLDAVQMEQVLINLIKNAQESMQSIAFEGVVSLRVSEHDEVISIAICDQGSGISNPENLFVPFYSTKPNGSGIGLVLCRQIIEAHGGRLALQNRQSQAGCCATIELPRDIRD